MQANNLPKLIVLLKQTKTLLLKQDRKDLVSQIEKSETELTTGEKVVFVCGEFKRGKSSLINALLERDDVCPVDADIATAVVSIIRYGAAPKATRYFGEISSSNFEEIQFENVATYAKGKSGTTTDTWLIEIQVPCEFLKDGIVLVDTPGVGGLDPRHGFLTSHFMPRADVIVFVADAGIPLSDSELAFLKEKVANANTQVIIALNKSDQLRDPEAQLTDIRSKINDVLGNNCLPVGIVPVSSRLKSEYLSDGCEEDLHESGFPEFVHILLKMVQRHESNRFDFAIHNAVETLNDIRLPLALQVKKLNDIAASDISELKSRFAEQKERIQTLIDPSSEWQRELTNRLTDLHGKVLHTLQVTSIEIGAQKRLHDTISEVGCDPNRVLKAVEDEILMFALNTERQILEEVNIIFQSIQKDYEIDMAIDKSHLKSFQFDDECNLVVKSPSLNDRIYTHLRNSYYGSVSGIGVAGGIIWLTQAWWAAVPAGLFMFYQSIMGGSKELKRQTFQSVFNLVSPEVQKALLALRTHVTSQLKEIDRSIKKAISSDLERAKIRHEETAKALAAVIKRNAEQHKELNQIVKTKIEPINQMLRYYQRLSQGGNQQTDSSVKISKASLQPMAFNDPVEA
ncbi:hypothetical protein DESC_90008 [Desulfosarcina cetonica]|uniref:dynamin family protein n=1 Tax=Desulfosarcina cetonica TaxID=90730 RepID=UPI0006D0B1E4|nr:dynamin family protein [Desulfosarcina cetonica]VTR71138.1 hypothetical protein DESC_90008 [Desulfosarcina cetonica]